MSSTAATRIFGTAELVEHILLQRNSPSDVISIYQVNTFTNAVVQGSQKLSAARMLGNKKILSNILFHLMDTTEIIKARQVHSCFKTVVDESKQLRQLLFLDAQPNAGIMKFRENHGGSLNPSAWVFSPYRFFYNEAAGDCMLMTIHPAIESLMTREFSPPRDFVASMKRSTIESITSWPSGTWEDMLICQPPCSTFQIQCGGHPLCRCDNSRSSKGATLGAMRDEILRGEKCPGRKCLVIESSNDSRERVFQSAQNYYWMVRGEYKSSRR